MGAGFEIGSLLIKVESKLAKDNGIVREKPLRTVRAALPVLQ